MPPTDGAATADLCDALGRPIPGVSEPRPRGGAGGGAGTGDGSGAGSGTGSGAGAGAGSGAGTASDALAPPPDDGTAWTLLVPLAPPGLDTLVSIIKPPLQIISALLQVVAALLEILNAILIGIPDLFRALILAAYTALKGILEDLIGAGFYLYFDAPGITSQLKSPEDVGVPSNPKALFLHGMAGDPPPVKPRDGFDVWADRFVKSFDDPGDQHRPTFSNGSAIAAVFIVAAAPSLDALRQALYLLGALFNIKPFTDVVDAYKPGPDPDLSEARQKPVAPDWESLALKDIFPALKKLLLIPEALKGLLLSGQGITDLISGMVQAIKAKVQTLQDLIAVIEAIIALLDALKATGLYALPVFTTDGPPGLKKAFLEAKNRPGTPKPDPNAPPDAAPPPPVGYLGGVCLLAGGPGIPNAATLFKILGKDNALANLEDAWRAEKEGVTLATDDYDKAIENLDETAKQVVREVEGNPEAAAAALGVSPEEAARMARERPAEYAAARVNAPGAPPDDATRKLAAAAERAKKRGPRSLALGLGLPGPPRPAPAPVVPLPGPSEDDCCEKKKP
jgi:hypothetical protein